MKYRNRTDIVAQMIEAASTGAITKTKMMYMAYVPHEQMAKFLALLVENELLSFDQQTHLYHTTLKGRKFSEIYKDMHQCATIEELQD